MANRDEFRAVVRDAAFAPVLGALVTDAGWRAALHSVAVGLRYEVVLGHPNLLPVVASSEHVPGPNVLTTIDRVLAVLLDDGFSSYKATWAFQMIASLALDRPADPGDLGPLAKQGSSPSPRSHRSWTTSLDFPPTTPTRRPCSRQPSKRRWPASRRPPTARDPRSDRNDMAEYDLADRG